MNRCVLLLLLVSLAGCGGTVSRTDTVDPPPPVATTVAISPTTLTFSSLEETQQLTATVMDQNGAILSGASASWTNAMRRDRF